MAGTASYNSATNTETFTPTSPLAYGTTYTATVSGAKDTAGDAMSGPVTWSFTTDPLQPSVGSYSPASGATGAAVSSAPTATFNEAVQLSTITFTLANNAGTPIAGAVTYNSTTNKATFTPSSALAYGTTYTATVSGAKDLDGDPMSGSTAWSFATDALQPAVSSHSPASGATGVAVSSIPSATFNEAVQATTINFTLANSAGTSVVGSASYDSTTDTATFTPSAALANGTTYTATVSGAKDAAGDPMSAAISWSFTTAVETTFYVSPTGNDSGPGTQQSPWLTLQNAANEVVAGDTVIVEPGNYAGFALGYENPQTGTASAPITWQAQPGAVIDARNPYTADGIDLESASYINVEGFTVDNTSGTITRAGIRAVNDTNVLIENNTAENCGQWAIFSGFSNNLDIVDNVASGSTVQHGIYVSNTCSNPAIIGNTVFGNNESGIELNGDASEGGTGIITGALIEDNIIYDNGAAGGSAINCDGVQNSEILNNLMYGNQAGGIALFQTDGGGPSINNIVADNTIVSPSNGRFDLNIQDVSGISVYNNIFYNSNAAAGSIEVPGGSLSGFTSNYNVIVNAFSANGGSSIETLSQWQSSTGQDLHSIIATPSQLFVSPATNNYQELSTSPSIGAGTATDAPSTDILGNPRPSVNGYDIGAYEYETSTAIPPAVASETPASGRDKCGGVVSRHRNL